MLQWLKNLSAPKLNLDSLSISSSVPCIPVAIVNESTSVSNKEVGWVASALQVQITRDFAPVWGADVKITVYPNISAVPATSWVLAILDNADQAGALGYHNLTASGLPLGKVFAKTSVGDGQSWSVVASHELIEMLGDPYINLSAFAQVTNTTGTLYAYELCDAVEGDEQGYVINQIRVSNFVFPAWFETTNPAPNSKFDFLGHVTAPFQLLAGGYISKFEVSPTTTGWQQVNGAERVQPPGSADRAALRGKVTLELSSH